MGYNQGNIRKLTWTEDWVLKRGKSHSQVYGNPPLKRSTQVHLSHVPIINVSSLKFNTVQHFYWHIHTSVRHSEMRGSGESMNNSSLSDLLQVMELSPSSKAKSSDTGSIGTKDSLRRNSAEKLSKRGAKKSVLGLSGEGSFSDHSMADMFSSSNLLNDSTSLDFDSAPLDVPDPSSKVKEGSTPKRSKRGGRKSDEKSDLERSLSGLAFDNENEANSTRVPKDCQTVSTMDSIDREKCFNRSSKRGGKKNVANGKSDLERSLSGLDFDDENICNLKTVPSDCHTVSTMDSIDKERSSSKPLKRGGKKINVQGKSDLERSLSGLNLEDDNFYNTTKEGNDVQTVSTMDSLHREKSATKQSKRGGKKNDLSSSQQPYEKVRSASLTVSLSKLGGPPRDFGRQADDNDTFCDDGGKGEIFKRKVEAPLIQPFIMKSSTTTDNDDSDSEDEDLFSGFPGTNPFRLATHL